MSKKIQDKSVGRFNIVFFENIEEIEFSYEIFRNNSDVKRYNLKKKTSNKSVPKHFLQTI